MPTTPKPNFKPSSLVIKKKKPGPQDPEQSTPTDPLSVTGVNSGSIGGTLSAWPIGQAPRGS
jgi:hypothetical protein